MIALAETLDVRDAGTAKHSQMVGRLAELTARELGLPLETVERVRLAGILHDVGKVGVPDSVLKKPGPLTEDEWTLMRKHPEIAARILEGADMDDIREWVLAHQERPDGEGYPRGLKGDEIPVEARILAVADAYEAMVSERVYRPALTQEAAQLELLQCSGSQFDPVVVRAFLKLLTADSAEGSRTPKDPRPSRERRPDARPEARMPMNPTETPARPPLEALDVAGSIAVVAIVAALYATRRAGEPGRDRARADRRLRRLPARAAMGTGRRRCRRGRLRSVAGTRSSRRRGRLVAADGPGTRRGRRDRRTCAGVTGAADRGPVSGRCAPTHSPASSTGVPSSTSSTSSSSARGARRGRSA